MTANWPPPAEPQRWATIEFRAMASPCRIVTDDVELAEEGHRLVKTLEQRWSRFIASSEVSAINRAAGELCIVSRETYHLVELAEAARCATGGVFNPLVLDRLELIGYNAPGQLNESAERLTPSPVTRQPIELYPDVSAVRLPLGSRLDPGGIGKGLAGDLVADALIELGAERAQIELGGDVRLVGSHWMSEEWAVDVRDPRERNRIIARLEMPAGAIATSSTLGRAWRRGNLDVHHVIDPMTGLPSDTDLNAVTVIADRLWWAEIIAKAALISGSDEAEAMLRRHGVTGLIVHCDGEITVVDDATRLAA